MNVCVENDRFQVLCCLFLTYGQYSILNNYAIYLLLKTSFFPKYHEIARTVQYIYVFCPVFRVDSRSLRLLDRKFNFDI